MQLTVSNIVLAAKRHEIEELGHLASKARLVGVIGHLIHALQNERGASSIFLASSGLRCKATLSELSKESRSVEQSLRACFEAQLENPAFGNAKLFSLMAWVLLGLDGLPALRRQIAGRKFSAEAAVAAISRLISGLISLVFEVADAAIDPDISRLLVALFNLVQGKELAGQERAVGALSFAAGRCEGLHQQRAVQLIDAQERSFQVFCEFVDAPLLAQWQQMQLAPCVARLERLRRVLCSARPGAPLDANLSDHWFECCSERLAAMWALQCALLDTLNKRCTASITAAERDLQDAEGLLKVLRENPPVPHWHADRLVHPGVALDQAPRCMPTDGQGGHPGCSISAVLRAQSTHLANMKKELDAARRALKERKTIERAKGALMARFNLSEEAAYRTLRNTSMQQSRCLAEVAEATMSVLSSIESARGTC